MPSPLQPQPRPGDAGHVAAYQLVLPTDLSRVADAVEALIACCGRDRPLSRRARFRLCTVAAEALTNAMAYGNANDPGRRVTVDLELHAERIVLAVTDEGDGFDPTNVPELTEPECLEATRGRGLFIIRRLAAAVTFNDRGNTIWVTLSRH